MPIKIKIDIDDLIQLIADTYGEGQRKKLRSHFNVCDATIRKIVRENGLQPRLYARPKKPIPEKRVKKSDSICVGYRFGKWTVLGLAEERFCLRQTLWKCQCACGSVVNKTPHSIINSTHKKCSLCANNGRREIVGELTNRYWKRVVDSARARGIPLSVSRAFSWELFLKQERKCALTGITLVFASSYEGEAARLQTASLDRIDSDKDYTEDNVQWVHRVINRMKGSLADEDLVEWCSKVHQHRGQK